MLFVITLVPWKLQEFKLVRGHMLSFVQSSISATMEGVLLATVGAVMGDISFKGALRLHAFMLNLEEALLGINFLWRMPIIAVTFAKTFVCKAHMEAHCP